MSFRLVSRADWGARRPKATASIAASEPSTIHWNGPKVPDRSHDKCAALVRGIQNFHMDGRGWSDIAYNFVVCRHGYVFEGRGCNARSGANGKSAWNKVSYAVMFLGGETNAFPEEARRSIREVVGWLNRVTSAPNRAKCHRDWKSTACPGDVIAQWVKSGMPLAKRPSPTPEPTQEEEEEMFKTDKEAEGFVRTAYETFAGRKVESDNVLKHWVYHVRTQSAGFLSLLMGLHKEHQIRHQNQINKLKQEQGDKDCTVLTEQQILATVAKALENG